MGDSCKAIVVEGYMDLDSEVKERAQSFNLEVVSATISNYPLRQIDPKLRPRKMGPIEDDSNLE